MLIQLKDPTWERRFTADTARVSEAVELYRQLGYEVRTESAAAESGDDCNACHAIDSRFETIYTRKRPNV